MLSQETFKRKDMNIINSAKNISGQNQSKKAKFNILILDKVNVSMKNITEGSKVSIKL